MITIICGEDTVSSRSYYTDLKKQFKDKMYNVQEVKAQDIAKVNQWLADSPSLFSQRKVFFTENLNKFINRVNKQITSDLEKIHKMPDIELIDWEKISAWELKLKKLGRVKEFKPDSSIFKLLDNLYPGNKSVFITQLRILSGSQDQNFIFIMILRTVRNLILVKSGEIPPRMQAWQNQKLKSQAAFWKLENLVNFYESLFRIEVGQKTGSNPFSITESLEILACHFL